MQIHHGAGDPACAKTRRNVVATHFVFRETGDRQMYTVPVCSEKPSQNNLSVRSH